jgi:predicted nucleotidyltransferase component of viral defense system
MNGMVDKNTWKSVLKSAFDIFDDLERRDFGTPPFTLGGGTVLMFSYKHRLSKDVDFFGYDAQWLNILSPRLNDKTASLASDYVEQSNSIKIIMPHGDIDFVISPDVTTDPKRRTVSVLQRTIALDPNAEILAKKLFYRASGFKPRDVYDMSAAIDLEPNVALAAKNAAISKKDILIKRLFDLSSIGNEALVKDIVPYDGPLRHANHMVMKVASFIADDPEGHNKAKEEAQLHERTIRSRNSQTGPER